MRLITFEDISKDFYYDFVSHGEQLGYSRNYIGGMIKKLKTIIQSAYDEVLHTNGEFKKKYFKKFKEEVNHPYLTNHEIQLLYELDIKSNYLDTIRDILEKRNGNFPPFIHQNKINKEIKPLLKKCGITELYPIKKPLVGIGLRIETKI